MKRASWLVVLLLLSGCAAVFPKRTAERQRELDEENQRRVMKRELARSHPHAPTPPLPTCSEARTQEIVRVTCRAYSAEKRHTHILVDQILRMAAESTLAAGKSHFSSLGFEILQVQATQPACHEERERSFGAALAAGLQAYGDSMASQSTTNCTAFGNQMNCTTTNPPPRPVRTPPPARYRTVCEGGGELQWMDSAESFEMLDEAQAAARSDPLIPVGKRPIDARAVLAPRSASQPVPTIRVAPISQPSQPSPSQNQGIGRTADPFEK